MLFLDTKKGGVFSYRSFILYCDVTCVSVLLYKIIVKIVDGKEEVAWTFEKKNQ